MRVTGVAHRPDLVCAPYCGTAWTSPRGSVRGEEAMTRSWEVFLAEERGKAAGLRLAAHLLREALGAESWIGRWSAERMVGTLERRAEELETAEMERRKASGGRSE